MESFGAFCFCFGGEELTTPELPPTGQGIRNQRMLPSNEVEKKYSGY
jgi:hypothetical protein